MLLIKMERRMLKYLERVVEAGDCFNGILKKSFENISTGKEKRHFYVSGILNCGWSFPVRSGMGFRDLCCLSYRELLDRRGYIFEAVTSDKEKKEAVCRALAYSDEQDFYELGEEAENIRESIDYKEGMEAVVVPSKMDREAKRRVPPLIFYDPDYPDSTGIVLLDNPIGQKIVVGRRIKVRVEGIERKGLRRTIITRFLDREREIWFSPEASKNDCQK